MRAYTKDIENTKELYRWGPIPATLFNVSAWCSIYNDYPGRLHHYRWPRMLALFKKNDLLALWTWEDLYEQGAPVFDKIILTKRRQKFFLEWKKSLKELELFYQKLNKLNFEELSDQRVMALWREYIRIVYKFWIPAIIPELGAYAGEAILRKKLESLNICAKLKTRALSVLSAVTKPSFYQEEEIDQWKLVGKLNKMNFPQLLKKHQQEYFWLTNSYFDQRVLSTNYFYKQIKEKSKSGKNPDKAIRDILNHLKQLEKQKVLILKKLPDRTGLARLSKGLTACIWWQDQRKKHIFKYLHYQNVLIKEIARRAGVKSSFFDTAMLPEVKIKLTSADKQKFAKRRRVKQLILFDKNIYKFITDQKVINKIFKKWQPEKISTKLFSGTVVYGAKKPITGRVYIVTSHQDVLRFPSGRIIVSTMTAPEYVTAIKKSKAIVTDVGGLTCHAAIVARELKVPCVVGTKVATKILKNGDRVEVDANNGIVRKI